MGEEGWQIVSGIAVDAELKKLYVLKSVNPVVSGFSYIADEIDTYSTEASGWNAQIRRNAL